MKIINTYKFLKQNIHKTQLYNDKYIVFIEKEKFIEKDEEYKNLYIVDYIKENVSTLKTTKPAHITSLTGSGMVFYYANINNNKISFSKIDCIDKKESEVLSINLDKTNIENSCLYDSVLYGIDNRYVIFACYKTQNNEKKYFFDEIILIDSIKKKSYAIPDKLLNEDTLLNLDEIFIDKTGKNITFKTGRIRPFEKKQMWSDYKTNGTLYEEYQFLETIISIRINNLIEVINSNKWSSNINILTSRNIKSSVEILYCNDESITFYISDFSLSKGEIKIFNFNTHKTDIIQTHKIYDNLVYDKFGFYGIKKINKLNNIAYKILDNKKIFEIKEHVLCINNKNIFTFVQGKKNFVKKYKLNNKNNFETYECSFSEYDFENQTLFIY